MELITPCQDVQNAQVFPEVGGDVGAGVNTLCAGALQFWMLRRAGAFGGGWGGLRGLQECSDS